MLRKVLFLFSLILKSKYKFNIPKKDIIIFDDEGLDLKLFQKFLDLKNTEILTTRNKKINSIFISPKMISLIILYLLKGNKLSVSYFIALIISINPKLVLTRIDNSTLYSLVAKKLHKRYFFLAIQNAARYQFDEPFYDKKILKDLFIPELGCFGNYEKDLYQKHKIKVNKFFILGSLKLSNYLENRKIEPKEEFDICLILEESTGWDSLYEGFEDALGLIATHTERFAKKNNLKLVLAGKRATPDLIEKENKFYGKYLKYNWKIESRKKSSSYHFAASSKVVVGMMSTLLRESLSMKKKILSCNFTGCDAWDFPINGICFLKNNKYEFFEERIKKIMALDFDTYKKHLDKDPSYLMTTNSSQLPTLKLANRIKEIIKSR